MSSFDLVYNARRPQLGYKQVLFHSTAVSHSRSKLPTTTMLKRRRPSSPMPAPPVADEKQLPDDLYEPMCKRRRFYAPPGLSDVTQGGQHEDEQHDDHSPHTRKYGPHNVQGEGWRKSAGVYKDANVLLHDLHAEQRHRVLFSSHSTPSAVPPYINDILDHQQPKAKHAASLPPVEPSSHDPESTEARVVAQRYSETNRCVPILPWLYRV